VWNLTGEGQPKDLVMDVQRVWKEYGAQLRNFLASRVSTPEDAEDLLQEILIKTHKKLSSVKEPEKFKAWLFQVARNGLMDYYRKRRSTASEQNLPEHESLAQDSPDQVISVYAELSQCIKPFLGELPEKYRQAIEEVDLNGTSQKELAEGLGLSHSAVKSRVQRGRQLLKDLFETCCSYDLDARGNLMDYKENSDCC